MRLQTNGFFVREHFVVCFTATWTNSEPRRSQCNVRTRTRRPSGHLAGENIFLKWKLSFQSNFLSLKTVKTKLCTFIWMTKRPPWWSRWCVCGSFISTSTTRKVVPKTTLQMSVKESTWGKLVRMTPFYSSQSSALPSVLMLTTTFIWSRSSVSLLKRT